MLVRVRAATADHSRKVAVLSRGRSPRTACPRATVRSPDVSNLRLRLLTAAVGLPLIAAATWLGGWTFAVVAGAVALLAAAEFVHGWLFPSMPMKAILPMGMAVAGSAVVVAGSHAEERYVITALALAGLMAAAGYSRTNAFGPRKPWRVQAWCLVYTGAMLSTLVLTRDGDDGRAWVLIGILGTFAVDTGAYAVGRLIGRHKLAPKISPNKTREGAVGGYVAGLAATFALNAAFDTGVSALTLAPYALLMPIAAQAGDLFESWMKRRMGVKDASGLLPGHGGFLDRMDSLLFVFPLLYVFLRLRVF